MITQTKRPPITAEEARANFHYEPETGHLCRKGGLYDGSAGFLNGGGYRQISYHCRRISTHRLAWLITYGEWPPHEIDHINGVRDDNRLTNLRAATNTQNMQNRPRFKNNKLGVKGVIQTRYNKFRAQCMRDRKWVLNKTFDTLEEATLAYQRACLEYHGVFSRLS